MRLTAFTDYTLRTLIYVALRPDRLVTIAEIAAAYQISSNHLMKVVQHLSQAGDITTLRGQRGGLRLARPAETINIGAVVRQAEPDMQLVSCFGGEACCTIQSACRLPAMLDEALQAFMAVLDRYTLGDLVKDRFALAGLLGIGQSAAVSVPEHTSAM
jgi:Rrf2 family nitric oxide-sensitive transcriptional repressor